MFLITAIGLPRLIRMSTRRDFLVDYLCCQHWAAPERLGVKGGHVGCAFARPRLTDLTGTSLSFWTPLYMLLTWVCVGDLNGPFWAYNLGYWIGNKKGLKSLKTCLTFCEGWVSAVLLKGMVCSILRCPMPVLYRSLYFTLRFLLSLFSICLFVASLLLF